ncbi:MAG TPA: type II toxin-antitoxin system VapB family antitoxin [Caulobacteraceae bacterium]|jgi:antitoxin VapB|nr:type II toxin-antitoxin system VapB family antitoxin [Caulobacteraceae bacterium]
MTKVAKLFSNGRSQAVRLPREFRFDGAEVFIRRDPASGDVILSRKPGDWDEFFALLEGVDVPADFMADRRDPPAEERDPL